MTIKLLNPVFTLVVIVASLFSYSAFGSEEPTYSIKSVVFSNFKSYSDYGLEQEDIKEAIRKFLKLHPKATKEQYFQLADELTLMYRKAGLLFHQVTLRNEGNKLRLIMIPGRLQDVHVRKNKRYSDQQIDRTIRDRVGRVVQSEEIEKAIARINDLPGLDVFSFFSLGSKPGDARLNIRVKEEHFMNVQLGADSLGTEETGKNRTNFALNLYNPLKKRDQLDIQYATTELDGNDSVALSYNLPMGMHWSFQINGSYQNSAVGEEFNVLGLEGTSQSTGLGIRRNWNHSQWHKANIGLMLDYREESVSSSTIDFDFSNIIPEADAAYTTGKVYGQYSFTNPVKRWVLTMGGSVTQGQIDARGTAKPEEEQWNQSNVSLVGRKAFKGFFGSFIDSSFTLKHQSAENSLPSFARLALTGRDAVVGFPSNALSVDEGSHARIIVSPIQFNLLSSIRFRTDFQYDYGQGSVLDEEFTLSSAAWINRFSHKHFKLELGYSQALEDKPELEKEDSVTWFSVGVRGEF